MLEKGVCTAVNRDISDIVNVTAAAGHGGLPYE